jgi:transcriptional regulator with XRE-family HTH domain
MQTSLAERLRIIRAQQGLTLVQAAEKIGVDRHTLRDLELGRRSPYFPTVEKIAKGYGVPVEELLEEPASPKAQAPPSPEPEPPEVSDEERRFLGYLRGLTKFAERFADRAEGWLDERSGEVNADAITPDELRLFVRSLNEFYEDLRDEARLLALAADPSLPDPEFEYVHRIGQYLAFALEVSEKAGQVHSTPSNVVDIAEARRNRLRLEEASRQRGRKAGA